MQLRTARTGYKPRAWTSSSESWEMIGVHHHMRDTDQGLDLGHAHPCQWEIPGMIGIAKKPPCPLLLHPRKLN